jgi:small-conductance mechanosensitive channel
VTQGDTDQNSDPQTQAEIWKNLLQEAITQAQAERSSYFLWRTTFFSIALVFLTLMLQRLLQYLGLRFRQYLLTIIAQNNEKEETDLSSSMALNLFLNLAFLLLKIILWLSTLLYIANLFPFSRQWSYVIYHTLISSFSTPLVSIGDQKYSVVDFLILFALFFALLIGASAVTNFLRSRILQFTGIGKGTQAAIAIVSKYTILSIGTIVLLQVWGLDLSSLTIFASAIGVAIGFGFQDIAKNFASGLILLFERPIQVGDFIEVGNFLGTVEHIGARSTLIRTLDHISIIVPNSRFLENEVINWSHQKTSV